MEPRRETLDGSDHVPGLLAKGKEVGAGEWQREELYKALHPHAFLLPYIDRSL